MSVYSEANETPNHALQRTPGFAVQLPRAAVVRPAQSRAVLPAAEAPAQPAPSPRAAVLTAPASGPESLSLGSLGRMKTAEEAPDKRPSKILLFVIPALLAVFFVVFSAPQPRNLFSGLALGVFVYLFSFVFLPAAWHGFKFFRSFFRVATAMVSDYSTHAL